MICLDTNTIIAAISRRVPQVRTRLLQSLEDGKAVGIPAIVLFEMWYGIKNSTQPNENASKLCRRTRENHLTCGALM